MYSICSFESPLQIEYKLNDKSINLVLDFVDCSCNCSSEMFHTDVNVFHCVICVGIVKHKGFLDLLMMVGKFLDLGAVALDRSLNRKLSIS